MKGIIIWTTLVFGTFTFARTAPMNFDEIFHQIWSIPQKNGTIRWMTEKDALQESALQESSNQAIFDKVRFFLYTPENPIEPTEIDINDPETLIRSNFNPKNPTRFMVHGWMGGYDVLEVNLIREALLVNGENRQYNFIAVDWRVYAASDYTSSQKSCSKVGPLVAELIDWMHDIGNLSFDTLALYGHSMGAHVVGFAGKNVKRGKVHTIVGMDPAMPEFNYENPESRLSETDAKYVESIHTNGGGIGFYLPIGKASFYPNGGKQQPGCDNMGCDHLRSVELFAEALTLHQKNGFNAVKCIDFENLKEESCNIDSNPTRLGDPNNALHAKGIYYVKTNSQSPFGLNVIGNL